MFFIFFHVHFHILNLHFTSLPNFWFTNELLFLIDRLI